MASASTNIAATRVILKPSMTLKGHGELIESISYFPDGQRMISGSSDKTTRIWDLKAGKETEEARNVCEEHVYAVAVSRDGRWIVTGGGYSGRLKLKTCEVETGIVNTFEGHSSWIFCIDISTDSTLLASGSGDDSVRIWNLNTGKLVAGPFQSEGWIGAVRFSTDSKKLAARLDAGECLEVWDVQSQKMDVRIGEPCGYSAPGVTFAQVFWTSNNKTIIAAFTFIPYSKWEDHAKTIYEFDASTLEVVGTLFEGHTKTIHGLALSSDCTLLPSDSDDETIKLWAFESRQLLASFDLQNVGRVPLSSHPTPAN